MRRAAALALCLLGAFLAAGMLAACGEEHHSEVAEGEPIEIGELSYNVQLTRFLNPDDPEDAEYLVGQQPADPGTYYLGVFMVVENQTGEVVPSASDYTVTDTLDTRYEPLDSNSPYALEIGSDVPADDQLPAPDSTAATGPNQGSLLIFHVKDDVSDNRPLRLEIEDGSGGSGDVILDI